MLAAERQHLADLVVGLEHDAAALADAMDGHVPGRRLVDDGAHRPRPFARRDLDAVLPAVRESLRRRRQVVRIAHRQTEIAANRHEPFTARLRNVPMPSMTTSIVSPALNARVVPGVPVKITSPGSSVTYRLR